VVVIAAMASIIEVCVILTDIGPALSGHFRTKSEALKACESATW
jgi:hypothetical protein